MFGHSITMSSMVEPSPVPFSGSSLLTETISSIERSRGSPQASSARTSIISDVISWYLWLGGHRFGMSSRSSRTGGRRSSSKTRARQALESNPSLTVRSTSSESAQRQSPKIVRTGIIAVGSSSTASPQGTDQWKRSVSPSASEDPLPSRLTVTVSDSAMTG